MAVLVSTIKLGKAFKNAQNHVHARLRELYPNGGSTVLTVSGPSLWALETGTELIKCDGWEAVKFEHESDIMMFYFRWT